MTEQLLLAAILAPAVTSIVIIPVAMVITSWWMLIGDLLIRRKAGEAYNRWAFRIGCWATIKAALCWPGTLRRKPWERRP